MTPQLDITKAEDQKTMKYQGGSGDTVYGIGLIGAWVYFIGPRHHTPRAHVKGFFEGLVWPAFLVYALFEYWKRSDLSPPPPSGLAWFADCPGIPVGCPFRRATRSRVLCRLCVLIRQRSFSN